MATGALTGEDGMSAADADRAVRRRTLTLVLLTLTYFFSYMDRQILAILLELIKADLKLWRIDDDDLELKPYSKLKRATAWVSDDQDRLLLKVAADIFVGSVWAELKTVQFVSP